MIDAKTYHVKETIKNGLTANDKMLNLLRNTGLPMNMTIRDDSFAYLYI